MMAEVGTQEPTVPSTPQLDWCHRVIQQRTERQTVALCSWNGGWHKVQALPNEGREVSGWYTRACFHTEVDPCGGATCVLYDLKGKTHAGGSNPAAPVEGQPQAVPVNIAEGLEKALRSVPR